MAGVRPLLAASGMRAAEAAWFAAGNDSFALMTTAAGAVADAAARMTPAAGPILVIAGPGSNGGDGYVAARLLEARGYAATVAALVDRAAMTGDAARAAAAWPGAVLAPGVVDPRRFALVIDALFGIGLTRALTGEAAELAGAVNAAGVPVLAVDIPSGVDADSGTAAGPAVRATQTISFHTAKPGHLLYPGRALCGALEIADIGLPPPQAATLFENGPVLWTLPWPDASAHKYQRGGVVVWSGPALATGAARLAATAALRIGAGAVTLAGDREAMLVQAAHVTAVMLAVADAQGFGRILASPKVHAACVGPGAGHAARCVAGAALQSGVPLVLDADALTAFADDPAHLARMVRRHPRPVVLTPHEGEFARLFPDTSGSKLARAQAAATATGATLVLKGPDTVIAAPDGRAAINANAPAWLATAGSGDVLAGFVAGLLAQGMGGFEAAAAAAYVHGEAGSRLGPGLIADDIAGPVLREVLAGLQP